MNEKKEVKVFMSSMNLSTHIGKIELEINKIYI